MTKHIDIVFDGPSGPESGRFIEVEDDAGKGMKFGEWVHRQDGYWVLRITNSPLLSAAKQAVALWRDQTAPSYQFISAMETLEGEINGQ